MTDMWDDEDRAVLAHLPFDEVAPPPALEDRVMTAALNQRPARDGMHRRRWGTIVLASAAVIAVVLAVAFLTVGRNGSSTRGGRLEPASATHADVDALVRSAGARTGTLPGGAGHVVLATDGRGYLYDLRSSGAVQVGVETSGGLVELGSGIPQNAILGFRVDNPSAVQAVVATDTSGQELRAALNAR
jgi:hypothetical protein